MHFDFICRRILTLKPGLRVGPVTDPPPTVFAFKARFGWFCKPFLLIAISVDKALGPPDGHAKLRLVLHLVHKVQIRTSPSRVAILFRDGDPNVATEHLRGLVERVESGLYCGSDMLQRPAVSPGNYADVRSCFPARNQVPRADLAKEGCVFPAQTFLRKTIAPNCS